MQNNKYFYKFITLITVITFGAFLAACTVMSGRETTGQYIDDATITSKIKTAIMQDHELKATQIHVETFQGDVQLSGFIDSLVEKMKAEALAQSTKGVRSVKNNLTVRMK